MPLSHQNVDRQVLVAAHILVEMANGLDHSGRKGGVAQIPDQGLTAGGGQDISQPPNQSRKRKVSGGSPSFPLAKSKKAEEMSKKRKMDDIELLDETNHESHDRGDRLGIKITLGDTGLKNLNKQTLFIGGRINQPHPSGIINEKRKLIVIPPKQRQSIPGTFDTGFSFSIIYFLSAIRVALTTPDADDLTPALGKRDAEGNFVFHPPEKDTTSSSSSECTERKLPTLTFDHVMQRVRSEPGDARVLEMKARLQDLTRGVLRILSSTTPPPGITLWKPLVVYDKSTKFWSWVGPLPSHWPRADDITTSPEAWGISRGILNRLVGCFGVWLKATQDVLQKIASLPPPPLLLMPQTLPQERFRESRNLKNSVRTIGPSCEEVRAYYHKEEALRYLIPEQAFSYTTRDGRKSTVVPLKKCSGSKKSREHFILKPDRPPSFTILCLVRDAAARLPHHMGTRSDICTLIRDSQFVKEDATDSEIKQVVSGALDRLHYERDPCIKFDKDKRLWSYLHGNKEEEDFDENCTLATKK